VMEAIQDILDELETVYDNIGKSARDHIHSECVPFFFFFYLLYPPTSKSNANWFPHQRNYIDDWQIKDSRDVSQVSGSLS
jgi:hypothetical protein